MNKIFRNSLMLAAVVFGFSACTDEYEYDGAGEWNAAENCQEISFVKASESVTLEESTYSFAVSRENTQGAVSVPFKVEVNTDEVFTVGEAKFADGEAVALCTVDFSKAEAGKTYTLGLLIDDPRYSSYYSPNNAYSLTVKYLPTEPAGVALWQYTIMFNSPQVAQHELRKRADVDNIYIIRGWGAGLFTADGIDLTFTWDKETNNLTLPENKIGIHATYGDMFISDMYNYAGMSYSDAPCFFDPATSVAQFPVCYYVGAGYFGQGYEIAMFDLNASAAKVQNCVVAPEFDVKEGVFTSGTLK